MTRRVAALIVAAGRGTRMNDGESTPKQYRLLGGEPLLRRTIRAFLSHADVGRVAVVIHPDDRAAYTAATEGLRGLDAPVVGGATRQSSVLRGLEALANDAPEIVLVHDAVRPFVTPELIGRVIAATGADIGALPCIPVADTLKVSAADGSITDGPPRDGLMGAQTPQGFPFSALLEAHRAAAKAGRTGFTDDTAVAAAHGLAVRAVAGDPGNVKITTGADLAAAARRLALERALALGDIRIGTGYDVHPFGPGEVVMLGGVRIAHERGLVGHSDADVVLHALTDAILGALAEGDIGTHFPPAEATWKGADSAIFLKAAGDRLRGRGGALAHADVTIVCERPKIGPHREAMRMRIAEILGVSPARISIKATTSEKLGFTGRGEGIAAQATVTVRLPIEDVPP